MISAILGFSSLTSLYITYCDVRTFSFSLEHVHNWKPSPDIKVICALVCLVICYKKNEFVRSVCAVRHAVIHIDSCGCLSSRCQVSKVNDQSWLLHHGNTPLIRHCMFETSVGMLPAPLRVHSQRPLAPSATRVSANDKGDNDNTGSYALISWRLPYD